MESLLERLQKETPSQQRERSVEALEFFRARVRNIKVSSEAFYRRELGTLNKAKRFLEGRMYTFFYDPKTKEKLPYYDRFPLVLPLETIPGGFMGLNFHYIRPVQRVSLLNNLQRFATGGMKPSTRIDATYDGIKGVSITRNMIKKYLYGHVRSSFLRVDFDEAAAGLGIHPAVKNGARVKIVSESLG